MVDAEAGIVGDAGLHGDCAREAYRWCPVLRAAGHRLVDVERTQVRVDGRALTEFDPVATDSAAVCGDRVRNWTLTVGHAESATVDAEPS